MEQNVNRLSGLRRRCKMIVSLAGNDFRSKYASSQLGMFWAFFRPVLMAAVYIFVFSIIARSAPVGAGVPYALWLLPGLIVWFVFSDSLSSGVSTLTEYSYLVKNIRFDVSLLPAVKVAAAFVVHTFFVFLVLILYLLWGLPVHPQLAQLPYYYVGAFCLSLALARIASAVQPFFRDLSIAMELILLVGMWACPIMWHLAMIPEKYWPLFQWNPLYHLVSGYRACFMGGPWFWQEPAYAIVFWLVTLALDLWGRRLFRRLSAHFADVI